MNTGMKLIGKRISVLEKENLLSIVILPTADKRKLFLMFLWLLAWSVCGVIVLANYFKMTDQNMKVYIIIYLSFWAYFEFNIFRTFLWKRGGKEKLWIQDGVLHYQRELNKRGKVQEYNLDLVSKISYIELSRTSLADTVNQSFWIRGGERLEFTAMGKNIRFGMQLEDEEARALLNMANKFMKK
ncbi:MAG: hypothetical protein IT236_04810 [Bacteroidia bacterium]|nr:hypothetical protein [Bacteroidia bacterium]